MWGSECRNEWLPPMPNIQNTVDWAGLAKQWAEHRQSQPTTECLVPSHLPPVMQGNSRGLYPPQGIHSSLYFRDSMPGQPYLPIASEFVNYEEICPPGEENLWIPPPPPPPPLPPEVPLPYFPEEVLPLDYVPVCNPPYGTLTLEYNHTNLQDDMPPPPPDVYYNNDSWLAPPRMPMAPDFRKQRKRNWDQEEPPPPQLVSDIGKKKKLPAWIVDGLGKMEEERLKRLEKKRSEEEKLEKAKLQMPKKGLLVFEDSLAISVPSKSKFDSDSDTEYVSPVPSPAPSVASDQPVANTRTEEEKQMELILKMKKWMTHILLDVTNSEMHAIAHEVHQKALAKSCSAAPPALPVMPSSLGNLVSYDSDSESNDEIKLVASKEQKESVEKQKEKDSNRSPDSASNKAQNSSIPQSKLPNASQEIQKSSPLKEKTVSSKEIKSSESQESKELAEDSSSTSSSDSHKKRKKRALSKKSSRKSKKKDDGRGSCNHQHGRSRMHCQNVDRRERKLSQSSLDSSQDDSHRETIRRSKSNRKDKRYSKDKTSKSRRRSPSRERSRSRDRHKYEGQSRNNSSKRSTVNQEGKHYRHRSRSHSLPRRYRRESQSPSSERRNVRFHDR